MRGKKISIVNDLISRAQVFANRAEAENLKLFAGSNFRELSVASVAFTYCPNRSRGPDFCEFRESPTIREKYDPRTIRSICERYEWHTRFAKIRTRE